MMKFITRLFKCKDNTAINYPQETDLGSVYIEKDLLVSNGELKDIWGRHTNWKVEVNLINTARAVVGEDNNAYLYLYGDEREQFIPIVYRGFRDAFSTLSTRFGFNVKLFWKTITTGEKKNVVIWRKPQEATYQILKNVIPADCSTGFEVQTERKEFVSWDTTYDELKQQPFVEIINKNGFEHLRLSYPVQIGCLLINDLIAYFDGRTDVAVHGYTSDCFNKEVTDKSFTELYNTVITDLGNDCIKYNRESEYEKYVVLIKDGIRFSITYDYDDKYSFEKGFTELNIENTREYPLLLENEQYEKTITVSDSLIIESAVSLQVFYKKNERVKRRPPLINKYFGTQSIIWRDDLNGKIGFADATYSLIFDKSEIINLTLSNLVPAKGPGSCELTVYLSGEKQWAGLFIGEYQSMNEYVERIASVIEKEVIIGAEYSDC